MLDCRSPVDLANRRVSNFIMIVAIHYSCDSSSDRRTHYRKHLTDAVLHDLPEPQKDEKIARVVAARGGNQFDVCVANDSTVYLAILPTKFHKLVWVKRGDYVLVQVGGVLQEEEEEKNDEEGATTTTANKPDGKPSKSDNTQNIQEEGGIRHMITHILYKDQVKHLQAKGLWPDDDPEFSKGAGAKDGDDEGQVEDDDGIVYQDYDDDVDDDLFVNTNRIARLEIQDSSEDDSSDEES